MFQWNRAMRVRKIMNTKKYSVADLAGATGKSAQSIDKFLTGTQEAGEYYLKEIAVALGVTIGVMTDFENKVHHEFVDVIKDGRKERKGKKKK